MPGTSGAPASVNGSRYTACEAGFAGAGMAMCAIELARDRIGISCKRMML